MEKGRCGQQLREQGLRRMGYREKRPSTEIHLENRQESTNSPSFRPVVLPMGNVPTVRRVVWACAPLSPAPHPEGRDCARALAAGEMPCPGSCSLATSLDEEHHRVSHCLTHLAHLVSSQGPAGLRRPQGPGRTPFLSFL